MSFDNLKRYGWSTKIENKVIEVFNRLGKKVAIIKGNDTKYTVFCSDGVTKLLSGHGNMETGIEKVAVEYFYASKLKL